MILSFKSKALFEFWTTSLTAKIDSRLHSRLNRRLQVLDVANKLNDLQVPGFDFHALRGFNPTRYSIHINGPWCLTFSFEDGDVHHLDLEQYH